MAQRKASQVEHRGIGGTGALLVLCVLLAGCMSAQPVPYTGIASVAYLKPNLHDDTGRIPYLYSTQVNWSAYSKVIIDPVEVYKDTDNQFGDMPESDRGALARYMQAQFTSALAKRFTITNTPTQETLRIKLTLTGAATSTPVLSTFSRVDMAGSLYNGVQAVRDKEGLMTGWVMYAVEVRNAATGQLLEAFTAKQYPNAYNIAATFGSLAAARTGVDKGADMLAARLK